MRVVSLGSVPPEWGGLTRGGVATFHATLVSEWMRSDDMEVAGVVPFNVGETHRIPAPVFLPADNERISDFHLRIATTIRPNAVVFNHIANRWAAVHARLGLEHGIGIVHSWHAAVFADPVRRTRSLELAKEAISGLSKTVFPSQHTLLEGMRLGVEYRDSEVVIEHPIHEIFCQPVRGGDVREGICFVGGLIGRKNPMALLRAVADIPELPVTFCGSGPEREALVSFANERLPGRAKFIGECSLTEVRDVMRGARLLCLPSQSESFGIAFTEALASGTAVVGFGPTLREIQSLMGMPCGRPIDDVAELPEALRWALAQDWDRPAISQRAIEIFSPRVIIEKYNSLIREVA